ncbi:hypothetical protein [Aquimarina aquimarini]|uniref:hypothetical protein n=1 Tax=Aquimarina aquimarini TaxID=1191734 RepID=UPI000D56189A|nr:hypothetical protein [Aquimarina aquimarini]
MKFLKYLFLIFLITSCEDQDEFNPSNLGKNFTLNIENNEAPSDGISKIKVIAEFPSDFSTETDNKVDFTVFKQENENSTAEIILIEVGGTDKKIAELLVSYNIEDTIQVKATIQINSSSLSKEVNINFKKAFLDSINVFSSSLTIKPNSFDEIDFTTELIRNKGIVSLNSIAETRVEDTLGASRGIFNDYKNRSNKEGKITNKFTLGNDNYTGKLFVISSSKNILNQIETDSLIIYSQN